MFAGGNTVDHAEGIDREVSSSQSANSNQSDIPSGFKHGGVEDAGRPDADEAAQPADFPAASRPPTGPTNGLSQVRSDTASLFSHWAEDQPPQTHGPAAVDPALGHPSPQAQPDARHFHDVAEPSRHDVADPQPDVATPMGTGFHPRLRAEMEHRFGEDFSGVSVQRGLSPEDQSAGVRAVAEREHVTADSNILDNQLHPENKQILAEELAHVVQKRRGSVVRDAVDEHGPERGAQMAPPHRGELEDEAQTAAARAVAGENVTVGSGARAPARQFSLWSWAKDKAKGAADWVGDKASKAGNWVGDKVESGGDWLAKKIDKGADWIEDKASKGASWVGDKLGKGASWVGDKLGKGMDWLGNSWLGKGASWVGDKLGKGASWVGDKIDGGESWLRDKVSKGTDWLSHTWVGKIARGVGKVGSAIARPVGRWLGKGLGLLEKGANYLSSGINKGVSAIGRGVDWFEDKVGSAADWVAKKTAGIPVLGTMTQMGASFVKFQSQVVGGFVKGGVDMIGGLANMALHPVDTATGLFHLAEHLPMVPGIPNPFKLAHNLYDVAAGNKRLSEALNDTFNPWKSMKDDGKFLTQFGKAFLEPYIQAVKDGKPGEAVGRLGFDVLMLIGTDGAGALGRGTGEALNTAGKLEQGTKVLSELEKAEQGTKVLSEAEKAEQGLKTLSKEAEPELSKAKDGPKALSDGEKAEPAATKTGEQPKPRLTSEEYPGRREPSPQASKPAPQIHSAEWEQGAKKAREDVKRGHKDPDGIWDQNVLKSEKGQDLKTKLDAFDEGKVGKSVKDFKTAGKSPEQIHRELLEQGFEHKREPLSAGKDPKTKEPLYKKRDGTTTTNPSDPDVVPHDIYVNPKDGGMVRVKPEGDPVVPGKDAYRPEPHVSKSVVYDPAKGTGFENEAFKVTDGGDAVPKTMSKDAGMKQAPKGSKSVEENRGYKDAVMQDAHTDLPEQEPSLIKPPTTEMQGGSK
jgi:hypothetical protein